MKKGIIMNINGLEYEFSNPTLTVFQACSLLGINIPCFCYHEQLSIAGHCRMCLVELNVSLKLVISCSTLISNNILVITNSNRVRKSKKSVLEFLLINHPLDCPICDQGGECDLQDIVYLFGFSRGRFYESTKRSVISVNDSNLIKMSMTRCIHCTKCIRFLDEISGEKSLTTINRGGDSVISSYIVDKIDHELSGNIIDLCPVGALTAKPYSNMYRS
jgi:NADH-quinone oxidoreductase subunit G